MKELKKKGNYIRVDTSTPNNKNYLNQQLKQLVSYLSLRFERFFQQLARQSTSCRAQGILYWYQQVYKSKKKRVCQYFDTPSWDWLLVSVILLGYHCGQER